MPGYENQASRKVVQLLYYRGQMKIIQRRNLVRNHSKRNCNSLTLIMSINTKPMAVINGCRKIKVSIFNEFLESVRPNHRKNHLFCVFVADDGKIRIEQLRILSQYRRHTNIDMYVACSFFYRPFQDSFYICTCHLIIPYRKSQISNRNT